MRTYYFYNLKTHLFLRMTWHTEIWQNPGHRDNRGHPWTGGSPGGSGFSDGTKHEDSWALGWKGSWWGPSPTPFPSQPWHNTAHRSLHLLSTYFLLGGSWLVNNIIALLDRGGPCISERLSDLSEATQAGTNQCPGLADPRALIAWGGSHGGCQGAPHTCSKDTSVFSKGQELRACLVRKPLKLKGSLIPHGPNQASSQQSYLQLSHPWMWKNPSWNPERGAMETRPWS